MAKGVPQSFHELKSRVAEKLQNGANQEHVQNEVVDMGDAMLQAGVEPKNAQDRVAKRMWQASGPKQKEMLANMVTRMAKDDDELS
ncbi:MAG: DUF3243 domain-containing protein [Sulfobacillus thermosulfidooxidans]|uniref:DUF3243 domain-containing protein n=1 Tax=Sulfobacillus thermotolerans TaxID=338644 RepID=A0ABM6RQ67_9FIRM|nr:DUF3243 family protein [Sulfobacillus sp. hq2]AUW93476.1 hypothetical protein BXT84_05535 [Sulfobacillus thermotolerans]MCY0909177.1 DUF3243 family protein [Sulfobacillus thermotolerans]POB10716.1 hypothetical protein CO251_07795 [Sulfobacillus sp. hq2]PSR37677.1 MAG: DUF3243 domain-containing protein [Sulfobacillus thermosulfidooxidans]